MTLGKTQDNDLRFCPVDHLFGDGNKTSDHLLGFSPVSLLIFLNKRSFQFKNLYTDIVKCLGRKLKFYFSCHLKPVDCDLCSINFILQTVDQ